MTPKPQPPPPRAAVSRRASTPVGFYRLVPGYGVELTSDSIHPGSDDLVPEQSARRRQRGKPASDKPVFVRPKRGRLKCLILQARLTHIRRKCQTTSGHVPGRVPQHCQHFAWHSQSRVVNVCLCSPARCLLQIWPHNVPTRLFGGPHHGTQHSVFPAPENRHLCRHRGCNPRTKENPQLLREPHVRPRADRREKLGESLRTGMCTVYHSNTQETVRGVTQCRA